jgi:hypothetical protein
MRLNFRKIMPVKSEAGPAGGKRKTPDAGKKIKKYDASSVCVGKFKPSLGVSS